MEKKYIKMDEGREVETWGRTATVYEIVAAKDFDVNALRKVTVYKGEKRYTKYITYLKHIKAGQIGGCIEADSCLPQEGSCWVDKGAIVFKNAELEGDSWVGGNKTTVDGKVIIRDQAKVFSDDNDNRRTDVYGEILIAGMSRITASLGGKGAIKNKMITKPSMVRMHQPKTKATTDPLQVQVNLELKVNDKKLRKQFEL